MTVAQMRQRIRDAYSGANWKFKVDAMSDNQVLAVHSRLMSKGKIK